MTFSFSLCAMPLLVVLVTYFRRGTQDILADKSTRRWRGVLLLTPEDGGSLSQFSG